MDDSTVTDYGSLLQVSQAIAMETRSEHRRRCPTPLRGARRRDYFYHCPHCGQRYNLRQFHTSVGSMMRPCDECSSKMN